MELLHLGITLAPHTDTAACQGLNLRYTVRYFIAIKHFSIFAKIEIKH